VIDTLKMRCDARRTTYVPTKWNPDEPQPAAFGSACDAFDYGKWIFNRGDGTGDGKIRPWRVFISSLSDNVGPVDAYPLHFALVTRWLINACGELGFIGNLPKPDYCWPLIEGQYIAGPDPLISDARLINIMASRKMKGPVVV